LVEQILSNEDFEKHGYSVFGKDDDSACEYIQSFQDTDVHIIYWKETNELHIHQRTYEDRSDLTKFFSHRLLSNFIVKEKTDLDFLVDRIEHSTILC
jgi:hypothetical protein